MGSNSLQGDADFATKVLRPMGCEVTQTPTQTTVQGPQNLKPLPSIDMETMTDAFLTASVLAAVAGGVTQIYGIANQRVKECNRIAAMVEQLGRFGVKCGELPDGIEINGVGSAGMPTSALHALLKVPEGGVKCYDDHRIAMSFSLLACVLGGTKRAVITEKKCVEKTWPGWWDALERKLGTSLVGSEVGYHHPQQKSQSHVSLASKSMEILEVHPVISDATIVIIGMRGAGKTHMGAAAARALNRKFIDMDAYFEKTVGVKIPEFLKSNSWDQFRQLEVEHLNQVLSDFGKGHVISCGGGIVETASGCGVLKRWAGLEGDALNGHVIHIQRNIEDIVDYLSLDKTRPVYGQDTVAVWKKRRPFYEECSSAEFYISKTQQEQWSFAETDFVNYLKFLLSSTPQSPLQGGEGLGSQGTETSYFLSLVSVLFFSPYKIINYMKIRPSQIFQRLLKFYPKLLKVLMQLNFVLIC
jgi:pentafunctional AROM polypeptide